MLHLLLPPDVSGSSRNEVCTELCLPGSFKNRLLLLLLLGSSQIVGEIIWVDWFRKVWRLDFHCCRC